MEKELKKVMNKFYLPYANKYELVYFVAKNKLKLDHYGKIVQLKRKKN